MPPGTGELTMAPFHRLLIWYIVTIMLLSIVVPTKNRPATLAYAVRAALALPSDDLELVVQDCSDDNRTQDAIAPFAADGRLRYEKSVGAPSMTDNWNLAFERVRGE